MATVNGHRRVLEDRYELGEVLGRGGMAEVRAGWDHRLGREVAVKILRSDRALDMLAQARFRREALSVAALNHPAIVAVYDSGEEFVDAVTGALSPTLYIVMELVHGTSLYDLLKTRPPDLETALRFTSGVLSALECSHRMGLVHRDIKPANVMITQAGGVKVMDFGIARAMADATSSLTQTLSVIGTAEYLSPEQARGEQVDTRSDLYSAGCLLYELLTGRPPFVGDSPVAVAYQHVRERPQPAGTLNRAIPKDVERVLMRALAKSRASRYQTAEDFRRDLDAARGRLSPSAPPVSRPEAPSRTGTALSRARVRREGDRRRRVGYGGAAVVALAIGALVVWLVPKGGQAGEQVASSVTTSTAGVTATSTSNPAPTASSSGVAVAPSVSATASAAPTTRAVVAPSTTRPAPSTATSRAVLPPSPSRSLSPSVAPAAWNGPCAGQVELSNSWAGAYQAVITVRNTAGTPVPDPWRATIPLPGGQTLANGWDATVGGIGTATVTAAPYTGSALAAGGALSFVVQVNAPAPVLPSTFTINGVTCAAG